VVKEQVEVRASGSGMPAARMADMGVGGRVIETRTFPQGLEPPNNYHILSVYATSCCIVTHFHMYIIITFDMFFTWNYII